MAHKDGLAVVRGLALADDEGSAEVDAFADRDDDCDQDAKAVALGDAVLVAVVSIDAVSGSVGVPVNGALRDCAALEDANDDSSGEAVPDKDAGADSVAVATAVDDDDSVAT